MKKVFAILLLPCLVAAQGTSVGGSFLKLPTNARTAALGQAVVADVSELGSISVNPANASSLAGLGILLSNNAWIQGVTQQSITGSSPLTSGAMALGITRLGVPGIPIRDIAGPPLGEFTAQSAEFVGTYAMELAPGLGIGMTAKYLYQKIYVDEATGYGIDLGVVYRTPISGLSAGASVRNLGHLSAFKTQTVSLPRTVALGASYRFQDFGFHPTLYTSVIFDRSSSNPLLCVAAEENFEQTIFARVGYQSGIDSRGVTLGLGAVYSLARFDYAFLPFSSGLGNAHIVSVGFSIL